MPKPTVVFCLGGVVGLAAKLMIAYAYGVDWTHANVFDVYIGIPFALYGYTIFYTFILLSMIITLLLTIPRTSSLIQKTNWTPFTRGVIFSFGIMIVYEFIVHGIPRLI